MDSRFAGERAFAESATQTLRFYRYQSGHSPSCRVRRAPEEWLSAVWGKAGCTSGLRSRAATRASSRVIQTTSVETPGISVGRGGVILDCRGPEGMAWWGGAKR